MDDLTERRESKQPLESLLAEVFSKDHRVIFAGKLIQDSNFQGLSNRWR